MNKKIIFLVIAVLAVLVLLTVGLYWTESGFDSSVRLFDILENTLIALFGEYPDRPMTISGRLLFLGIFFIGLLVSGVIIGKISAVFLKYSLEKEDKMKNFQNHIILCNWNRNAPGIIKQLLLSNKKEKRDIVVISATKHEDPILSEETVFFVQADPTQHSTLLETQVTKAKSVILLLDVESANADAKNALIALAINNLEKEKKLDIHIISELEKMNRRQHLLDAGVDEIICNLDLNVGIIAQSALYKNMSLVYQRLLSYSDETNEIYFIPFGRYPLDYLGNDFPELRRMLNSSASNTEESPLILLGIMHENDIFLNPKRSQFFELQQGDSLIVISYTFIDEIKP